MVELCCHPLVKVPNVLPLVRRRVWWVRDLVFSFPHEIGQLLETPLSKNTAMSKKSVTASADAHGAVCLLTLS